MKLSLSIKMMRVLVNDEDATMAAMQECKNAGIKDGVGVRLQDTIAAARALLARMEE